MNERKGLEIELWGNGPSLLVHQGNSSAGHHNISRGSVSICTMNIEVANEEGRVKAAGEKPG